MATNRLMQRNNLADAFLPVRDERAKAALDEVRAQVGDAEWKNGYSPEKRKLVRDALKAHGAGYEERIAGRLVGVQLAETQANGAVFQKLRVTLENDAGKTVLSADMDSEFAQRLITKLDTATREYPGEEVSIGGFAKMVERGDRTFVDHVAMLKDQDGKEIPAAPGHFEKARERVLAAQEPLRAAGMNNPKVLNEISAATREKYFADLTEGLNEQLIGKGIVPQVALPKRENGVEVYPALEAGVRDRESVWHNLSLHEKDGKLVGTLQRRNVETGSYEKSPLEFQKYGEKGLIAQTEFENGARLLVSLSKSEPTAGGHEKVDVRVFSMDHWPDGQEGLTQIHEHPGRLRANEALQRIPDHREGKLIEKDLGVAPGMLNPAREASNYKAPDREQQRGQGVQR